MLPAVSTCLCLPNSVQGTADESASEQEDGSAGSFRYLLALHALTAADPSLAAPAADPQRYVRLLAPYTAGLSNVPAAPTAGRMSSGTDRGPCAEWMLCRPAPALLGPLCALPSHQDDAQPPAHNLLCELLMLCVAHVWCWWRARCFVWCCCSWCSRWPCG